LVLYASFSLATESPPARLSPSSEALGDDSLAESFLAAAARRLKAGARGAALGPPWPWPQRPPGTLLPSCPVPAAWGSKV